MADSDKASAMQSFTVDLIAGNIPDIILLDIDMYAQSYINKGIFADIYPFMARDPDFNKAEYLPNAFAAMEQNGKLFTLFPMFLIDTVSAKSSDVGGKTGWTLDEFEAYLDSKPDSRYIIEGMTRENFLRRMAMSNLINTI